MTTPVFNNPLQADLAGLQSVENRLKTSLQQFQAGVQTMAVALQQQHQQARRQFVDDIQQRFNRILQGDVDQEDSSPETKASNNTNDFWGGNS
jgi:exonuclease VII small subunit